jgi:hypothetical protein
MPRQQLIQPKTCQKHIKQDDANYRNQISLDYIIQITTSICRTTHPKICISFGKLLNQTFCLGWYMSTLC